MKKLHMARMFVLAVLFASGCALGMEEGGPVVIVPKEEHKPHIKPDIELERRGVAEEGGVDPTEQQQLRDRLQVVIDRLDAAKNALYGMSREGIRLKIKQFKELMENPQKLTFERVEYEEFFATEVEKKTPYAFQAKLAAQRTGSAVAGGIKSGAGWVKGKAVGAARKTKEAVAFGYKKSKAYKAKIAAGAAVTGAAAYFSPGIVRWTQEQIAKNPAVFEYFSKRNLAIAVGAAATVYGAYRAGNRMYQQRKRKGDPESPE